MNFKNLLSLVLAVILVPGLAFVFAENIDPNDDGSQYSYGENVGWLNFGPSEGPGVTVSSTELTGYVWAENIGWINLSPASYGGVFNDGAGNLSGYGWGENVGWINFDPNVTGDPNDYGVKIDLYGNFSGWAWGENIGWLNFAPNVAGDSNDYSVKACKVNFEDLGNFVDQWLLTGTLDADLSGDGEVDFVDYGILADYWLDYCPDDWTL